MDDAEVDALSERVAGLVVEGMKGTLSGGLIIGFEDNPVLKGLVIRVRDDRLSVVGIGVPTEQDLEWARRVAQELGLT